jgi:hypothetical protein
MKITKFEKFIRENLQDTPEEYVKIALNKIKNKIESFFENTDTQEEDDKKFIKMSDALKKGKEKEKGKSNISFTDLGLSLLSSEFSKYSSLNDSVKFIMSDEDFRYDLIVIIPLEESKVADPNKDMSDKDIKKCFIKFKKYDIKKGFEICGQINKNVEISSIDENLLVDLKIELDSEFGTDDEKLEIETD